MTTPSVRDRLLISAMALLRSKGADGFGMSELLEHSGVARRSMYQHFPDGKAELLEQATASAGRYAARELATAQDGRSPVDAFVLVLESWKEILTTSDYRLGCPLVAAALATVEYPAAAERAAEAFATMSTQIAESFTRDGVDPETARGIGHMLISSLEGAIITSRALRSVEPLDALASHVRHMWG
ncbi:TetR/AcrR family transcriptional regulator [Gordonia sp. (in: high G+C Gram-positive bacteria)]|uniref:TetR/AcrR family transcriptional regulator n=1 Tax=Gordonia sp. (in: high G+C Gram-positive bacteria) TaxID=84139 RepID=UPI001695260C|nr:TetR/AcrR family transcriptional regulator [Gordonia sp. (in: high G+C Gram-positive bacteria)]NLG45716.1 TetR/AcrR family transcriptional regulator [Gordonia sp. (in: high G+C Gram-positive bacteria)]